jgi:hypothetical protein
LVAIRASKEAAIRVRYPGYASRELQMLMWKLV